VRAAFPVVAAATLIAGASSATALAHGPCGCLDPRLTVEGHRVRIVNGYAAYRVIFNPRVQDLGIAPSYLASAYRADVETTTVLTRPRRDATPRARFRVPKQIRPGVYLVLIFDGSEGGYHNTWDYLHVTTSGKPDEQGVVARQATPAAAAGPTERTTEQVGESGGSTPWPLLGAALGGVAVGVAAGARIGKHRT
jgi:hypothetical protein